MTSVITICLNHPRIPCSGDSNRKTYVIGLYRHVEHTISHQLYQHIYMCDDLITIMLLYHASQLRATSVSNYNLSKSPPNPISHDLVSNQNKCDYRVFWFVEHPAEHQMIVLPNRKSIVIFTCQTMCYVNQYSVPFHDTFDEHEQIITYI